MPDLDAIASDLAPTGLLRAVINLGNPVLAQGTADDPRGVTVDLAREIGARIGRDIALTCVDAARHAFHALRDGEADVAFLAVEPARAAEVEFTAPYVVIEGVFAVPDDSPVRTPADVDRPGVRVGVKEGSAYDLFLTRTLERAQLVRGAEGTTAFVEQGLDVAAGIRQPMVRFVEATPGVRLVEERFMQIEQAVAVGRTTEPATVQHLRALVEELKEDDFVAASLVRSGQGDAQVAPPA